MSRRILFSCVQIALLMAVFVFSFRVGTVRAQANIYIRADGSIDPPTASISTSDNVTYTLNDDTNSSIVVERNNTVLEGRGHTIQGIGYGTGITVSTPTNVTVKNVEIKAFAYGIWLEAANCSITGCNITANGEDGIVLYGSRCNISRNSISGSIAGCGIDETGGQNNCISGNNITANGWIGIAIWGSYFTKVSGNLILGNRVGIEVFGSAGRAVISRNTITNNIEEGIFLFESNGGNSISDNNITANGPGIDVLYSGGDVFVQNNIEDNMWGIDLISDGNAIIADNKIAANHWYGIGLEDTGKVEVLRNAISSEGIWLRSSFNNTFSGNNITANSADDDGVVLESSSDNVFYHNNFVNNKCQANSSDGSVNVWDNGVEGNYWSDYNGTDLNYDGIGDAPYVIDANNSDRYPLMGMFHSYNASLPLLNSSFIVDLVSNSSISDFDVAISIEHPEEHVIIFNAIGESGTTGFCRVLIPTALMNDTFTVLINGTKEIPWKIAPGSNSAHRYLYFNYTHSTQTVIIVPEFPSFVVLPLTMIASLFAVLVCRRKHWKLRLIA